MRRAVVVALVAAFVGGPIAPVGGGGGVALAAEGSEAEVDVKALLTDVDDMLRGASSKAKLTMNVKTARWERSLTLQMWSQGTESSLIKILAPAKDEGQATLKVGESIWNYLPKVDRTIKLPAAMMSGSWMGSHFTNDDLVQESRMSEDYLAALQPSGPGDEGAWVIELTPRPDAPVVWGKVVVRVNKADRLPTQLTYFDEKGALIRTLTYSDVKEVSGRRIPTRMTLTPADKPEEHTELIYEELAFDVDIPPGTFTLQALKP